MTIYKRVSVEEREAMKEGVILGKTQSDIAKELNRNKSTISRELRRIWLPKELYSPVAADADAKKKQSSRKAGKKKVKGQLADHIENYLLKKHFSPEQTSQMLRRQFPDDPSMNASHEAIYQYIYSQETELKRRALIKCLRRRKKCRRRRSRKNEKRGTIRNMVTIHNRPEAANKQRLCANTCSLGKLRFKKRLFFFLYGESPKTIVECTFRPDPFELTSPIFI